MQRTPGKKGGTPVLARMTSKGVYIQEIFDWDLNDKESVMIPDYMITQVLE